MVYGDIYPENQEEEAPKARALPASPRKAVGVSGVLSVPPLEGTRGRQLRGRTAPCRSRSPAAPRLALALRCQGFPRRTQYRKLSKDAGPGRGRPEVRVKASRVRVSFRAATPYLSRTECSLGDAHCTGARTIGCLCRGVTFLPSFLLLPA